MIDAIYYINLDKRTDRLAEICSELDKMDLSGGIRFPAIPHSNGIVGCGYSHLEVLRIARKRKLRNVLIFEDDFEFLISKEEFQAFLRDFFTSGQPFDVLMLSYSLHNAKPWNSLVQRVYFAQTASGYLVNETMFDRLIELYETNIPILEQTGKHWIYANDIIWKSLQGDNSLWFATNTRIGRQRASFSDNSQQFCDYGI